jgi:hypothetical protein
MEYLVTFDINTDDDYYSSAERNLNGIRHYRKATLDEAYDFAMENIINVLRHLSVNFSATIIGGELKNYTADRYKEFSDVYCAMYNSLSKGKKERNEMFQYYYNGGNYEYECLISVIYQGG